MGTVATCREHSLSRGSAPLSSVHCCHVRMLDQFPKPLDFFFFSRETRDSGFYLQSPGVYNLAANKFSCFFFNANQMQCHPMGCQFKISDLAHLLFFSGQPSPGKVRWLVMWLETCSLVPRPCPPNKAWSSVSNLSRIGKNNKNLNLSKATLKVN